MTKSPVPNAVTSRFSSRARKGTAVLIGEFPTADPFTHFAAAMRADGWDIVEVELNRYVSSPGNRWVNAIVDRLLPSAKEQALGSAIEAAVVGSGADVALFAKGIAATPGLIARLAARGCRSICWYPDYHFDHPNVHVDSIPLFDLYITTKAFQMDWLRARRGARPTVLVEHGYANGVHRPINPPVPPAERPFDVAFVASHSHYKQKWMAGLAARLPECAIAIVGNRWQGVAATFPSNVHISGALVGDTMARAFGHARIALAVHHGPGGRDGWQDDVSARTFEIPACGTFMLHIDNDHVRTLFDVPGEIDVFDDIDGLAAKVSHYLAHPKEREAAAARAYARAVPAYSYYEAGRAISAAIDTHIAKGANT